MKYFGILTCIALMSLAACKSEPAGNAAKADDKEAYVAYDGQTRQIASVDTLVNNKGVQFELTFRGGSTDGAAQIKIRKDGKLIENTDRKADGRVTAAMIEDINGDGEGDFIFYTNTEDNTRIGNLYGVVSDNGKYRHIFISPFIKEPYVTNYFGRDSFYVENGIIYKSFPRYELNKLRQKVDSGKRWILQYKYTGKDTIDVSEGNIQ